MAVSGLDSRWPAARGLQRIGVLDKQTMREFDALIRTRSRVSQAVFAAMLNTSGSTVQKWEIGDKRLSGPSLKLLNVIQRKGIDAIS